jgi:hypothetical protein
MNSKGPSTKGGGSEDTSKGPSNKESKKKGDDGGDGAISNKSKVTLERRARVHPRKDPRRRVTRVLMRSSTKDPTKRETTMVTRAWNLQTN